jgi:hypothetical protein
MRVIRAAPFVIVDNRAMQRKGAGSTQHVFLPRGDRLGWTRRRFRGR